jgi:putative endonuclease
MKKDSFPSKKWVVYLVRCADKSLYCGVTNDMAKRLTAHNSGRGAKYTRSRQPVEPVAVSTGMSKSQALQLEYRVKQLPASRKVKALRTADDSRITEVLVKKLALFLREMKQIHTTVETVLKRIDRML